MTAIEALLPELVASAGLPAVVSFRPVRGDGFDHQILHATLADVDGWELEEDLDPALRRKVDTWRTGLATYLSQIGEHLGAF
jgi:hypothetical protein